MIQRRHLCAAAAAIAVSLLNITTMRAAASDPKLPPAGPGTVDIIARDYQFIMPATIKSGWTTFRFYNAGMAPHFALLTRLPPGKTFDDYKSEVGTAFADAMAAIIADQGDKKRGFEILGGELPAWFADARQMGGPGITAGGSHSTMIANLIPGDYVVECYIKTDDGRFHGMLGMLRPLTVSSEKTKAAPPLADARIAVYNDRLEVSGKLSRGNQIVGVDFKEKPAAGLANDVHLVRLESDGDLAGVLRWLDWSNLDGMTHHTPGQFVGGAQEMPVGYSAYMVLDLKPGEYAWVSEPGGAEGLVRKFVID